MPGIFLSYMNLLFILDVLRINAYLYWKRSQALFCGDDFKVGYTPERINPNDAKHTLTNTVKIVECL